MTPTPESLRHRAATRRWARAGLFGFTAASVAANIAVVKRRPDVIPEDIWVAALVPVVLAVTAHIIAKFLQSGLRASGIAKSMFVAGIAAVSVIAAAAFVISFENLTALMHRQHHLAVATAFPVMLDLAIVVCTGILVVIGIADENDQDAGVPPHRGWLARRFGWWSTAAPAVPLPATVAEQTTVPTVEQLAVSRETELTVTDARVAEQAAVSRDVPTPDVAVEHRGTEPAGQAVTCDVPRDTGDVPTEPIPVSRRIEVAEQPAVSRETQPFEAAEQGAVHRETQDAGVVEQKPLSRGTAAGETAGQDDLSRETDTDYIAEQDDGFARIAAHLVDAGRTQAPVEMAAAVLRGANRGVTVRELADATGISPSGVSRLTKAAKEVATELATTGS